MGSNTSDGVSDTGEATRQVFGYDSLHHACFVGFFDGGQFEFTVLLRKNIWAEISGFWYFGVEIPFETLYRGWRSIKDWSMPTRLERRLNADEVCLAALGDDVIFCYVCN